MFKINHLPLETVSKKPVTTKIKIEKFVNKEILKWLKVIHSYY